MNMRVDRGFNVERIEENTDFSEKLKLGVLCGYGVV
jgi:hypothetical protein